MSIRELLTPKQVATAIGVSESSLKRWCDRGVLPMVKTAGGHRRIPMSGVLKFLQQTGQTVIRPEVLGLPRLDRQSDRTTDQAVRQLREALTHGAADACRQILFEMFLAGRRLSEICDDVIRPTFVEIGRSWECGETEVYQERRACEITDRILTEMRLAFGATDLSAPRALGGTLSGDDYRLPTAMCELVLQDAGWRAASLGTNLPVASLQAALVNDAPQLVWLSVSHIPDRERFVDEVTQLFEHARRLGIAVVVGGNSVDEDLRQQIRFTAFCESMRQLEAFASSWKASHDFRADPPADGGDERRLAL